MILLAAVLLGAVLVAASAFAVLVVIGGTRGTYPEPPEPPPGTPCTCSPAGNCVVHPFNVLRLRSFAAYDDQPADVTPIRRRPCRPIRFAPSKQRKSS